MSYLYIYSMVSFLIRSTENLYQRGNKAPGQRIKQYIYQLAKCIQLKPVQATEIHLVDSISVHSNIKLRTVLPTERVIVYFLPKSYIAKLSICHYKIFHISPLVCVLCVPVPYAKLTNLIRGLISEESRTLSALGQLQFHVQYTTYRVVRHLSTNNVGTYSSRRALLLVGRSIYIAVA